MKVFKRQSLFNSFLFFSFSENVKNRFAILHRLFRNEEVTFHHFLCLFCNAKESVRRYPIALFTLIKDGESEVIPQILRRI